MSENCKEAWTNICGYP